VGQKVAIIGAGGIGFDVALFLTHNNSEKGQVKERFLTEWGIDMSYSDSGGLSSLGPPIHHSNRQVYLLQRKGSKIGKDLGKTTGWIHRATLKNHGVVMLNGVTYKYINDDGLTISRRGEIQTITVDTIVICAGQVPLDDLYHDINNSGKAVHLIGGAERAVELDAKRAIDQGCRLAATL
jgi:2,4-dienoyl-CoA reductase (NADPH2)